jgi:homoserine acetyltransferase
MQRPRPRIRLPAGGKTWWDRDARSTRFAPATGAPYRLRFPVLTVEDIARGGYEVLQALKLTTLAAVIGPSLGGVTAHAFCATFPGIARNLLSISAAARSTPFAIALRSLQREMTPSGRTANIRPARVHSRVCAWRASSA